MKKLYLLLFSIITASYSFGQATDLYFSMYGEGSSSNKFIEIYNGTGSDVDLSTYSVELYSNGSSTATKTLTFNAGTVLASGDVYVIANSQADQSILSVADITSQVTYFNGDDALALLKNGTVIDVIGEIGVDPGSAWDVAGVPGATANHTLTRKSSVCSPNNDWATSAGTNANDSEWIVTGIDTGWNELGSFSGCSNAPTTPSLAITAPTPNQVFAPNVTDVQVEFVVQNFTVAQAGGDGYIVYTFDNDPPVNKYDTNPIVFSNLTPGTSHQVSLKLVDNSGNDLNPPVTASVTFSIAAYTQVATIADLRAGTVGDYYHYTGEAFAIGGITYQSGNFKGFAQDATGGIMAFVPSSVMATAPVLNLYDGVKDVKGQLKDSHGTLEIEVTEPYIATGNNVPQTPQAVSVADYNANHDAYESELIKITNVLVDATGTTFALNTNYTVTDANDNTQTVVLRTIFPDLAGQTIPTDPVNITCIGGEYNGTAQIYPRDINDFETIQAIAKNDIAGLKVYPNPVKNKQVFVASESAAPKQVIIYNVLGKAVINTNVNNQQPINIGQLKAGIYLMKIIENNHLAVEKLIVK